MAVHVLVALVLAGIRIAGIKTVLFQAAAHLYVGGLFGAYFAGWRQPYLWLALGLTLVETICFLVGQLHG